MTDLSAEAQRAMLATVGRVGSRVRDWPAVVAELKAAGLVSPAGNLTSKGAGIRQEIFTERLGALS